MKQYIMGMLLGASLILCAVMFIGANKDDLKNIGRYEGFMSDRKLYLYDTTDGRFFISREIGGEITGDALWQWEIIVANGDLDRLSR